MTVAYLILTHRNPLQVGRLVRRLLHPQSSTHVHVDRNTNAQTYDQIVSSLPKSMNVEMVPRVACVWGSWGIVEATLLGIRSILGSRSRAEHIVVMSGQCYPLRSAEALVDFFKKFPGCCFVTSWKMPSPVHGPDGGMYRLRYWHQSIGGRRFRIPIARKQPDVPLYVGPQWMVLDRARAMRLLDFTNEHPDIVRFFRHTWIPDEHYIHTVLQKTDPDYLHNAELWYMDWSKPGANGKNAPILGTDDFEKLRTASRQEKIGDLIFPKLFARKFDSTVDSQILDSIDHSG
jgi:hypothetical protein